MELFRPVGLHEMRLIFEAGNRAFPPRLPDQPIFYPVLNLEYARQIARTWNTRQSALAGYVTRFVLDDDYAHRFAPHIVGSVIHEELWVPAEELATFNQHIQGPITPLEAYFGAAFRGIIPHEGILAGADATQQLAILSQLVDQDGAAFADIVTSDFTTLALHLPFWQVLQQMGQLSEAERGTMKQLQRLTGTTLLWNVIGDIVAG